MNEQQIVINVYGGLVQEVFCSVPNAEVFVVDWDLDRCDRDEPEIVSVPRAGGSDALAQVTMFRPQLLSDLAGSDVERAIDRADLAMSLVPELPH